MIKKAILIKKLDDLLALADSENLIIVGDAFLRLYDEFRSELKQLYKGNTELYKLIRKLPIFRKYSKKKLIFFLIVSLIIIKVIFYLKLSFLDSFVKTFLPFFIVLPVIPLYRYLYYIVLRKKQEQLKKVLKEIQSKEGFNK